MKKIYLCLKHNKDITCNNRLLLITIFSTILFWICLFIYKLKGTCFAPITKLIIVGDIRYTTNEDIIQTILKLSSSMTFINQNVYSLKYKIESLPLVKLAYVSKQWPNKLIVHIIEHIPIAYWNDTNLLGEDGELLKLPNKYKYKYNINIPVLCAPTGSERYVLTDYKYINKILKIAKIKIKKVNINDRYSWQLTLKNNILIKLGRNDKIERLKHFVIVYPILIKKSVELNKHISYIDLRYNSGLAVKWVT